jgi:hypothetical protein
MKDIFDLGEQILASRFPRNDEPDPLAAPLILCQCMGGCGLVQLKHTVSACELYTDSYGYRSGLNEMMVTHIKTIVEELYSYRSPSPGDIALDIGSNDGTLLGFHSKDTTRVGIDPTGNQFKKYYPDDVELIPTFFAAKEFGGRKADYITSISMFYDLPEPLVFMKDVASVLSDGGIWIMEQSYLPTMLDSNSYDTICHEHLEYYTFFQIDWMCKRSGLRVLNVKLNECNGGSFRVVICRDDAPYTSNPDSIDKINIIEKNIDLEGFARRSKEHANKLREILVDLKNKGKSVYLYGASTKGNTLLQYAGIDNNILISAAERNPAKYGRRTPGTNIPIVSESDVRAARPDYMLVLPWHFRSAIIMREQKYLNEGGSLIFPLPVIDIVRGSNYM